MVKVKSIRNIIKGLTPRQQKNNAKSCQASYSKAYA